MKLIGIFLSILFLMMLSGEAFCESLQDSLLSKDNPVRLNAQEEIKNLNIKSQHELASFMVEKLNDPDSDVSNYAIYALTRIDVPAIPSLTTAFEQGNLKTRLVALRLLTYIASSHWTDPQTTDQVIPILAKALSDSELQIRLDVSSALGEIGNTPSLTAVPELKKALEDENKDVRLNAAVTLAKFKPSTKEAIPVLIEGLKRERHEDRYASAWALGLMGEDAKKVTPELLLTLKDTVDRVRLASAEALAHIDPQIKESIPVLATLLKHEHPGVRSSASSVLQLIVGPTDKEVIPILVSAMSDSDPNVPIYAIWGLEKIGPDAVPALVEILNKSNDASIQRRILQSLKKINNPESISAVKQFLIKNSSFSQI